jgi:hypothetical protein
VLAGDSGALKERNVAIEVFGRHPDSGLGDDTIVRVGAREVRKRLAQYYSSAEGTAAPVVIELPLGSYVPEFRFATQSKAPPPAAVELLGEVSLPKPAVASSAPVVPVRPAPKWPLYVGMGMLAVAISAIAFHKWSSRTVSNPAFEAFWAPVLQSSSPMLIGVGHPIVYLLSHRAMLLNEQRLPPTANPGQRPLALKPDELNGSDIIPVQNQYVGFGDMVAGNDVSQMLARRGHDTRLLMASTIPFADLRHSPTYLIGSFSNRWTSEFSQTWRFNFAWTSEHRPVIRDTQSKDDRHWSVPASDDGSTPEDYCLIVRIPRSPTGSMLIVSAGIKQFGTEAAGRLLADPNDLGALLSKLPAGWENRNMQLVLHARVIGNAPTQPELVAFHVW